MFDIGWSELLLVVIVAIVVVGPKDLPRLMRTVGNYAGRARRAASDFRRQFSEAIEETEAEQVRENIKAIRANMGTAADLGLEEPIMGPLRKPGAPPRHAENPGAPAAKTRSRAITKGPESGAKTAKAPAKRAKKTQAKPVKKAPAKPARKAAQGAVKAPRPRRAKTGGRPGDGAGAKKPRGRTP